MCQGLWLPGRGNDWVGSVEKVSDSPQKTTEVGGRLGMYRETLVQVGREPVGRSDWEMSGRRQKMKNLYALL